jgi:MobA/MobL family
MAIYHLSAQVFSRGSGHSAVHAAAYRARDNLTDERTGLKHDYSRKSGELLFEGIYAPKDAPDWARDRQQLWNHVEAFERRRDAQLAREFNIALPHELTLEQNRYALQDWIRDNFTRKGLIADAVIHAPSKDGDERNMHAHVMVVMRKLDGSEFTAKKERAENIAERKAELEALRESWERIGNRHLERYGHEPSLDRRSLLAQGVEREPTVHMGKEATALERSGMASELGEANREITAQNERKVVDLAAERAMREARQAAQGRTDDIRSELGAAARAAEMEQRKAATGRTDDIRPDRSAEIDRQAEQAMQAAREAAKGRTDDIRPQPEIKPLGKTAGDICMAWTLSRSASELQEGLAVHGISLALASAEEARQSERTAAFAKEIGSFARVLREGEIVAVNGSGHVYRLDERTTGETRNEIEGRLTGVDRAELSSIADTKEAMREAAQAAWIDQQRAARERERLPSQIESRIAECGRQAWRDVTFADGADRPAGELKPEDEQRIRTARIHEAFAAGLDEAGIAIARATEADITAIAALREQEGFDRASGQAHRPRHFAADLVAGDMAAVTGSGDVYRINPDKLGEAKPYLAAELPGVIETRARFEIEREQKAELYGQRRADNLTAQQDYAAGRESQSQYAQTVRDVREVNQDIGEAVDTGSRAASGFLRGLSRMMERFFDFLGDMLFPAPPPTPDQAERMVRSAEEKQQAHAEQAAHQERNESQYWLIEEARRRVAEQEREDAARAKTAAERFGTPRAQEQDNGRERDRGYELER